MKLISVALALISASVLAMSVALAQQTCQMVEALQRDGRICRDVDATALGELIFNNTNMMFVIFIKTPEMTVAELIGRIRLQTEPVIRAVGCR